MYRVLKVFDTPDGRVEQEGTFDLRGLKKSLSALCESAVSIHVFPVQMGMMKDVSFDPRREPANDNEE